MSCNLTKLGAAGSPGYVGQLGQPRTPGICLSLLMLPGMLPTCLSQDASTCILSQARDLEHLPAMQLLLTL